MAAKGEPIKRRLRDYLAARAPAAITEEVWKDLTVLLSPVSESYLRDLLRATGLPFALPWAGIRQGNYEELEASLGEMGLVYAEARASGDHERARYCRRQVIAAKDRAYFAGRAARSNPAKKAEKEEMAHWMLVWLENPEVFPSWVAARRRAMNRETPA